MAGRVAKEFSITLPNGASIGGLNKRECEFANLLLSAAGSGEAVDFKTISDQIWGKDTLANTWLQIPQIVGRLRKKAHGLGFVIESVHDLELPAYRVTVAELEVTSGIVEVTALPSAEVVEVRGGLMVVRDARSGLVESRQVWNYWQQLKIREEDLTDKYNRARKSGQYSEVEVILEERLGVRSEIESLMKSFLVETRGVLDEKLRELANRELAVKSVGTKDSVFSAPTQVEKPRRSLAVRVTHSPVLPHDDMGPLPIFSERGIRADLWGEINAEMDERGRFKALGKQKLALSVALLVPDRIRSFEQTGGIFNSFRPRSLAKQIIDVAELVNSLEEGRLVSVMEEDYATRNPEQGRHLRDVVKMILAVTLQSEIAQFGQEERNVRKLYQGMSNALRHVATRVGERGFEKVAEAVNSLDGLQGAMIACRLSDHMYFDLGFPCWEFASEVRLGEMIRSVAFCVEKMHGKGRDGVILVNSVALNMLDECLGILDDRMETASINEHEIVRLMSDWEYFPRIIRTMFEFSSSEQRGILRRLLVSAGFDIDSFFEGEFIEMESDDE